MTDRAKFILPFLSLRFRAATDVGTLHPCSPIDSLQSSQKNTGIRCFSTRERGCRKTFVLNSPLATTFSHPKNVLYRKIKRRAKLRIYESLLTSSIFNKQPYCNFFITNFPERNSMEECQFGISREDMLANFPFL